MNNGSENLHFMSSERILIIAIEEKIASIIITIQGQRIFTTTTSGQKNKVFEEAKK